MGPFGEATIPCHVQPLGESIQIIDTLGLNEISAGIDLLVLADRLEFWFRSIRRGSSTEEIHRRELDVATVKVFSLVPHAAEQPEHLDRIEVEDVTSSHRNRALAGVVSGKAEDVAAVGVHPEELCPRRVIAGNEPTAPARHEDDAAVGQVGRIHVVPLAECQLPEPIAVGVDLVEVVVSRAAFAVRKEDLAAVVVHARVADSALGVIQQYGDLPGAQVELAQPSPVRSMYELQFV